MWATSPFRIRNRFGTPNYPKPGVSALATWLWLAIVSFVHRVPLLVDEDVRPLQTCWSDPTDALDLNSIVYG